MSLAMQIQERLKEAMKAKDGLTSDVLRMLKSEIKYKEIDAKAPLGDAAIQAVVRSAIKKRQESVEAYRQGGRDELADKEAREIAVLETLLPPQLSDEAILAEIDAILAATPEGQRAPGPLTGQIMRKLQGQADGKRVGALLKQRLGG